MSEIRFYHLQRTRLEAALPKMLERVLERGDRAVVMLGSEERVEALAAHLWTYNDRGFLPHGTVQDGFAALVSCGAVVSSAGCSAVGVAGGGCCAAAGDASIATMPSALAKR